MTPRLKTEIWVGAYMRRIAAAGVMGVVARRGDPDAGAVAVKVYARGEARVFVQSRDVAGAAGFRDALTGFQPEAEADGYLQKTAAIDPDLWIVEIEREDGDPMLTEAVFADQPPGEASRAADSLFSGPKRGGRR